MGYSENPEPYLSKKRKPLKWTARQLAARKRRLGLEMTAQEIIDAWTETYKMVQAKERGEA